MKKRFAAGLPVLLCMLMLFGMITVCAYTLGDVDGNDRVTASDARMTLRVAASLEQFTPEQEKVADVDFDGVVTATDARKILRVAAYLETFDASEPDDPVYSEKPVSINQDVFADIGLTYKELSEKYGQATEIDGLYGGIYFKFEKSPGIYFFMGKDGNLNTIDFIDENGQVKPEIVSDIVCWNVRVNAKELFTGLQGLKSISDIEEEIGVSIVIWENTDTLTLGYIGNFSYQGFEISLELDDHSNYITENSAVSFRRQNGDSSAPSESDDPSTEPVEMPFFNDSLLADIGQTYANISAKYIDPTSLYGFEGDLYAVISGRQYCFVPGNGNGSAYSGDFDNIVPSDDAVCVSIDAAARDLFFEFSEGMSASDLESHGISAATVSSRPAAAAGEIEGNFCRFEYGNCEVYILLDENSEAFFSNSQIFIGLR